MWQRVFGRSEAQVPPSELAAELHEAGLRVEPHFRGDDLGWTGGELRLSGIHTPVTLDRYLTDEDDIRAELNAHAAELETCDYSPHAAGLVERVALTRQLILIRKPVDASDEVVLEKLLTAACRILATRIDGVYQIDGQGWFAADGELLVREY